ncbi:hypothetical protein HA466_0139330 [Hirschfeldia incana]|nr:hypothetical protein HA466_0139330 [Hirschfeldia incana]
MFLRRVVKTPQISSSVVGTISFSRQAAPHTQWKGLSVCTGNDSELLRKDTFNKLAKIVAPFTVHLHVAPGPYVEGKSGVVGSGIIVHRSGTILTCAHVVTNKLYRKSKAYKKSTKTVLVTMSDGTKYNGVTFAYDTDKDIALIRIKPKPSRVPLTAAKAGDASEVRPGDLVMSGGSPKGWRFSFSKGIIRSHNRTHKVLGDGSGQGNFYLQSDCATAEGSSGGPLVNLNGEVIGVVVGGDAPGFGFAIRVDSVLKTLKNLGYGDSLSLKEKNNK